MQLTSVLATLGALFATLASSQQYAGEVIETSLRNVPGSEVAFFKIPGVQDSNSKKSANLTLINYYSHGSDGKRLVESKVQRAVIIIHGLNRDPDTYQSNMQSALAQFNGDPNVNKDSVAIMAPYFPNGDDKNKGYPWTDGLKPQRGSTTSALVWKSSQWSAGANNQYPYYSQTTSSYTVLDTLVKYFDDKSLFPNMKQIVVAGHSLGAQTVQRYAAIGQKLNTQSPVTYWIGNPNSYVWLSLDRPLSTTSCPDYDVYRDGYTNFTEYPMSYGQSLVSQGRSAILENYQSKQIAYARGTQDKGDDSSGCAPFTAGGNRHERFFNFIKAFPASCNDPSGSNCDTVDLVNMGHDAGGMMAAPAGIARLFTDNFYGNGNRSYDFGYPRLETWDDPYPDPSLNSTSGSVNNGTYAGNLTYAGCWSDAGTSRSLSTMAYDNSSNSIETCTSTCVARGFSIAGVEFGSQCYCGNYLIAGTAKVIESSCTTPCSGNSSQTCGNNQRLSVYSNGAPYVLPPASTPDNIGSFSYSNCYTDTSPRTLTGKFTSGSFMTLDYCADYCSGYKYFGTEYSSECYCGNTIASTAKIATATDCSMTCANNTLQYCGAGNRLTLYTNPNVTESGSSTTTTSSTPSASGVSGPSCPASDGSVVTSNGLNFTIECGFDHAGGDLTSLYVSSFQQCIDACSSKSQCVDVSLSGNACYLKKVLGAASSSPTIWGARLLTDGFSPAVSSTASSSSVSSSSQSSSGGPVSSTGSGTTSSSSATVTPSNIACPSSNATTYVTSSGRSFVIECGIDHQAGDMGSKYVDSFQQCIDACDQTRGCVDVSLSGSACYMKSSVGPAVNAAYVWGARLVDSASSSSSGSVSSTTSSSTSGSSTATSTVASQSASGTSSSTPATPTATVVSCPASNDTLYTLASGSQFRIECGIDHQGGDLSSKAVTSFAGCIAACDTTSGCVDVSMSGNMCYLKSAVGPAVKLDYIWGAKLLPASSASTVSSSTTSSLSSSTGSATTSTSVSTSSDSSTPSISSSSTSNSASQSQVSSPPTASTTTTSAHTTTTQSDTSMLSPSVSGSATSTPSTTSLSTGGSTSTSDSDVSTESVSDPASTSTIPVSTSSTSTISTSIISTSASSTSASSSLTTSNADHTTSTPSTISSPATSIASTTTTSNQLSSSTSSSSSSIISTFTISGSSTISTVVSSSSTVSSSTTGTSAASLPSGFSYAGCFIDSSSSRALPVSAGTSSTQTQQHCAMTCQTKGYKFSGTEYGNECWCGNPAPSSQAAESSCSMACKGDSTQKCGAGNRLSVVSDDSWKQTFFATQSSGPWNLLGCYTDSTAKRSLPSSVSLAAYGGGANATIANCMQACQAKGFSYCGAEYYSECFGSNSAPATSLASGSDPLAAGCNYPCKGNSSESCGGSARIIVYSTNVA